MHPNPLRRVVVLALISGLSAAGVVAAQDKLGLAAHPAR